MDYMATTQDEHPDSRPSKHDMGLARAERKVERIRRERRRLAYMRRRRRLRADDVTVIEESALRKAIMGSVVGNIMEWYDVGVYAYVAVLVGKAFLPDASPTVQTLFSLGVFAVTFVARPLGGVILVVNVVMDVYESTPARWAE